MSLYRGCLSCTGSEAETLLMGEYGRIQAEDENDSEELAECERVADEIQAE